MSTSDKNVRHILALSGGKDSAALAIYMKKRAPEMEYVFCDTGKELAETYEYLAKLEVYLNRKIVWLQSERFGFDDLLKLRNGFLPSPQIRWCTEYLKIKPYEQYIGNADVISYIGIRADESHRKKYISAKPNIIARYPFVEDGIRREDVIDILNSTFVGAERLGLPRYYEWRSRSGCFFCFFQQRREWVGLFENHPDLFKEAMKYEREDPITGERYTWIQGESLEELSRPERVLQIKREFQEKLTRRDKQRADLLLGQVFEEELLGSTSGCLICHL